jgi:uncharacterized protein (TIRG00374 family)
VLFNRRWLLLLCLSLVITALAPLLLGGHGAWQGLARIPLWGAGLLLAMIFGAWLCNTYRIQQLAAAVGLRLRTTEAFRYVMSAEFAGLASPAYVGGPATYLWLFTRRGLTAGQGGAILAVDQLTDLVFFATFLPLMLLLSLREAGSNEWVVTLALLPVIGVVVLVLAARRYRPIAIRLGRLIRHVPGLGRLRWRMARGLLRFRQAVRAMMAMDRWRLFRIYLACCLHWLLRYGVLPVVFLLLDDPQPWAWLFLIQAVILFAGHLTVMPGGAGGVEAAFGLLLGPTVAGATLGTALLAWRFVTFHWYLIAGAPIFLLTVGRTRVSHPPSEEWSPPNSPEASVSRRSAPADRRRDRSGRGARSLRR